MKREKKRSQLLLRKLLSKPKRMMTTKKIGSKTGARKRRTKELTPWIFSLRNNRKASQSLRANLLTKKTKKWKTKANDSTLIVCHTSWNSLSSPTPFELLYSFDSSFSHSLAYSFAHSLFRLSRSFFSLVLFVFLFVLTRRKCSFSH